MGPNLILTLGQWKLAIVFTLSLVLAAPLTVLGMALLGDGKIPANDRRETAATITAIYT